MRTWLGHAIVGVVIVSIGRYLEWRWWAILVVMVAVAFVLEMALSRGRRVPGHLGAVSIAADDPLMVAAVEQARQTWGTFRRLYGEHPETSIVKFRLRTKSGDIENVWGVRHTWKDGKTQRLEDTLNDIIIGLLEAAFQKKVQRAEQERARHSDELHEHECGDLRVLVDADLGAVDRRHPDDRLDPVVIEQERDQHQERLTIPAQLVERLPQADERKSNRVVTAAFIGFERRCRLPHAKEQWQ